MQNENIAEDNTKNDTYNEENFFKKIRKKFFSERFKRGDVGVAPTTQFFRTVGDDARKSPVCKQIFMQ
ncbi:MAG: hypothetical protein L6V93_14605 [Clostridiales bacterium]|nr:MAG: hypothetical protein L6V93_14605 [Clostridiales bacterium]